MQRHSSDADVVNDSTVSITTVPESSLDEAEHVVSGSSQNEVISNVRTGSLVSVEKPVSDSNSQPMIDVPVRCDDGQLVMVRLSLEDFSKLPIQEMVILKQDDTLNSSTQSASSFVFGKTAAEVACDRNEKQGLVNYSTTTDDMGSVDMFQMSTVTSTPNQNLASAEEKSEANDAAAGDAVSENAAVTDEKSEEKLSPPAALKSAVTEEKSEANDAAAGDAVSENAAVTDEKSGEKLSPPATLKSAVTEEKSEANDNAAGDTVTEEKSGEKLSLPATPKSTVTEEKSGEKLSPAKPKDANSAAKKSPATTTKSAAPGEKLSLPKPKDANSAAKKSPATTPKSKDVNSADKPKDNKASPVKRKAKKLDEGNTGGGGTGPDGGSTGGDDNGKVTITVHSNVVGLVQSISRQFGEYMANLDRKVMVKLSSTPFVRMTNITPTESNKKKSGSPVTKLAVTASVCASDGRSLKVYVDEDLQLEEQIISRNLQPAPTKGKEMSEYKFCCLLHFSGPVALTFLL